MNKFRVVRIRGKYRIIAPWQAYVGPAFLDWTGAVKYIKEELRKS